MEDNSGKILRLFGTLFFTFLGFIVALALLMLGVRFFFGLLSYISWIDYFFMIFILSVPAALFITVFIIYFKRTRSHRSPAVRWISYTIFVAALLAWIFYFVKDLILFSQKGSPD